MGRSTPSLLALLGLAAVAGYQNRDKLGTMLGSGQQRAFDSSEPASGGGGLGSILPGLAGLFEKGGAGGGLAGGLNELLDRFRSAGHGQTADTWVSRDPNASIRPEELTQALDDETLSDLSDKTGLSREDLIHRLTTVLPATVDHLTPNGRIPSDDEL